MSHSDWKPIVGLEIHAELLTETKMFSPCPVVDSVTAPPNTAVDPVSLGLPGTLPVINQRALEMAMMVGLALNCEIPPVNQFARKSYFYPDLPKGYQISQYDRPLCVNGYVDIDLSDGSTQRIRIRRAHLEEDTGKLTHTDDGSLIDYNRAGVPLLEIVTEPDIHSAESAEVYARKLRAILRYLGVNDGDMSKGIMRIEPNISVMHREDTGFRTRTEVKNLNSIRSLYRAIEYEVERQIRAWESGEGVRQATMGWDEVRQRTVVQRYKESAEEYRYFPEPDLPIVHVSREWVAEVRASLPELPDAKRDRFISQLGLSRYDASVLVAERAVADYYEAAIADGANPKSTANWMLGSLFSLLNQNGIEREALGETTLTPEKFGALVKLVDEGVINKNTAAALLTDMWETGKDARTLVDEKGLAQISDSSVITQAVDQVLAENAALVADFLGGKDKVFGPLVGKVMAQLGGKADPKVVREALTAALEAKRQ
ncbi:Asp-tRNA(Asn)/Glu-tRNA(Gln) amidotransferase subunit GatB [Anaerolineae bacterium CFX9]|jgi:aspartyl-tRNA(Asn)/glutamyl-tRNA(Gln) amidotransferase subunit B|nr:Asp-tRNA(Asn)/Glu-tRNA(Gln) amidotransferase subunit GatB [Anaerolineae bacterium CFX9]